MPRTKEFPPLGTVSSGTLRTEDLLDAFEFYCRTYGGKEGKKLAREYARLGDTADTLADRDAVQEEADGLLEDMTRNLEDIAPDFAYFGTLEGDGAEFGFWPLIDSLEDSVRDGDTLKVSDLADVPPSWRGHVMHVSDYGNVTLYTFGGRKFRELWSVV